MKGRIFTPVLSFIGISILFHGCHSSVDSTTESSKKEVVLCKTNAKKTDIKSLKNDPNEERALQALEEDNAGILCPKDQRVIVTHQEFRHRACILQAVLRCSCQMLGNIGIQPSNYE